jgi:hypothetical protein
MAFETRPSLRPPCSLIRTRAHAQRHVGRLQARVLAALVVVAAGRPEAGRARLPDVSLPPAAIGIGVVEAGVYS